MNIKIVCVGKLKENYWTQAVEEYLKRIGRFAKIEVAELKETRISDRPSKAEEEAVKKSEGEEILKRTITALHSKSKANSFRLNSLRRSFQNLPLQEEAA